MIEDRDLRSFISLVDRIPHYWAPISSAISHRHSAPPNLHCGAGARPEISALNIDIEDLQRIRLRNASQAQGIEEKLQRPLLKTIAFFSRRAAGSHSHHGSRTTGYDQQLEVIWQPRQRHHVATARSKYENLQTISAPSFADEHSKDCKQCCEVPHG